MTHFLQTYPVTDSSLSAVYRKDDFKIGSKVIIPQDVTLRGAITIGTGSVLHPKCTIVAMGGPIVIGIHCIIEENVVIVNRSKQTMIIGDYNLFQVGCREL
jgi:dynactin-6